MLAPLLRYIVTNLNIPFAAILDTILKRGFDFFIPSVK